MEESVICTILPKIISIMKNYTKEDIIRMCQEYIKNPDFFYQNNFVNYRGRCKDCNELYTEVIAEYIIQNLEQFKIKTITRSSSCKIATHKGIINENSNRVEEKMAISMYRQTYEEYGTVLDYQIPLKNSRDDKRVGKIDLISLKEDTLYLLELKRRDNKETLLRCVLEIYTYISRVNHARLLADYNLDENTKIIAAPLICENGFQHNEFLENKQSKVIELMNKLNIHAPFTYKG